jgi:RNA polymerase sigma-70 factor (ECF subfamily)
MNAREYNECVRQFADDLYRFALRYCGDGTEAEDAVQEVFLTLWERHNDIRIEGVKGYLVRLLYRRLVDLHRHHSLEQHHVKEEEPIYGPHERFELRDALQKALKQLPEEQKVLVLLHDLEGYSYSEMAELTHLNEQQVGVYLWRGRKTLRKLLEDYR